MDTLLEEKRNLHEERDRLELAIVSEMLSKKTSHKDKLDSEHRQKILLDRYMKCSETLIKFYEQQSDDKSCPEAVSMHEDGQKVFNQFYSALDKVRDFYAANTNEQVVTMASEFEEIEAIRQIALGLKPNKSNASHDSRAGHVDDSELVDNNNPTGSDQDDDIDDYERARREELARLTKGLPATDLVEVVDEPAVPVPAIEARTVKLVEFTDEEGYGRYLDMNKCYEAFLQVIKKEETKPNYITFLDKFDRFADLKRELKLTSVYKNYVEVMLAYFRDYGRRARPLVDFDELETEAHEKFVERWNNKTLPGWFRESDRAAITAEPMVDLEAYKSCDQLIELGLDCLKRELQARGLKCGGTLEERAKRLWSIRGKSPEEIAESLKATFMTNTKGNKRTSIDPFYVASIEAKLSMYAEYFNDHRLVTIENVQRKQARTADERNESDEDISDGEEEETDQNDVIYNPKNLPLGWDGKPIPYWLYKLHGLNITFTCEICGNATYKGPKTFQRHFAEWRHAHGMRCLGIPNTAHFANITKIQDAIILWEKLKTEKQKDKFQPLVEEEFEDSQGNVVNKKIYEDLKRQGLL